jgi:hypothetical protein
MAYSISGYPGKSKIQVTRVVDSYDRATNPWQVLGPHDVEFDPQGLKEGLGGKDYRGIDNVGHKGRLSATLPDYELRGLDTAISPGICLCGSRGDEVGDTCCQASPAYGLG